MTPTLTPVESTIEGFVWEDQNRDGQRDAGEPGIAGLLITLKPQTAGWLRLDGEYTTLTDAAGHYRFEDVAPGSYVIQAEDPAQTYVHQQPAVNADETSWREGTQRHWLWLAATPLVALFLVLATRGAKGARQLLGAA